MEALVGRAIAADMNRVFTSRLRMGVAHSYTYGESSHIENEIAMCSKSLLFLSECREERDSE